jgi:hypothetical protein
MGQICGQLPILQYLMVSSLSNEQIKEQKQLKMFQCNPSLLPQSCTNHTLSEFINAQISPFVNNTHTNARYCGYIHQDDILYVFGQINALCKITSNTIGGFSLIDEIVNSKSSNGLPICSNTSLLFTYNPKLCFLYDTKNRQIEIPIAGYTECHKTKLQYHIAYGIDSSRRVYCTNVQAINSQLNSPNFGILRVALFISDCNIISQSKNINIDENTTILTFDKYNNKNTYTYYPKLLNGVINMKNSTDEGINQIPLGEGNCFTM